MTGLPADVRAATERWIEDVVIAQSFCPYAEVPYAEEDVLIELLPVPPEAALAVVYRRARQMSSRTLPETTLLTAPVGLEDFAAFVDFQTLAEELLEREFPGSFVTASFHPSYTFADVEADSPVHRIHRSPYPVLQLLRQASTAFAKTRHDAAALLARNRTRAEQLWGGD